MVIKMKIAAVTACIAGIAHTYMAKSALERAAKKRGAQIHVETQGAMGMEDKLSQDEIDKADVVIFAVDTNVTERDRFDNKKILEVGTNEVVKSADDVVDHAYQLVGQA
ncbi:MAG: fructose PTS transporter subunit IIB [Olsenella sp.]|jgi:PTS system fructose-specific IIB component/fructose-specific PTS system IIB-like component|nr:fructose PTS transporter subunit IIB [Olsenella sp.]MCI1646060.1 fructose PTS transporter subunit IIB [Olsenella sp.]MCI1793937.1 fructose PTS transporter subunit IIB [Olsenella sp.]MCI1811728.1 fructose PTS transporter subunit IIB [Olsenella sp.]MCI1879363.1 fructose PTS transporter subunit IIB [Olsenella sp.]